MKKTTTILLTVLALGIISCTKEGCTDEKAENYNTEANQDDGSCNYSASTIFWFNSDAAMNLAGELYTTLDVYVDQVKVGSIEIDHYSESAPGCGSSNGVNYTVSLGNSTSKNVFYTIKSKDLLNNDQLITSGTATLAGGECTPIQINY